MRSRPIAAVLCALSLSSCARSFRVLPRTPDYVLQSLDARLTPFPAVLRAYSGFEPGQPSMDLHSGMQLHIENAYYEQGASRHGLAGFLGTEVAQFGVTPAGLKLLHVQPMQNRPAYDLPVQQLISKAQLTFRYYRLYFEIFVPGSSGHASALLGANSIEELNQLVDPTPACQPHSPHCTVFPEACTVSVEIEIEVNGQPQTTYWGSTLATLTTHPNHLKLKRLNQGQLTPVKIDAKDSKALRLPLLPGDQISWN